MQEKQHATQVCRKQPPAWNRSAGYKCERDVPSVDISPKYMPCIGALTPGNSRHLKKKTWHINIDKIL